MQRSLRNDSLWSQDNSGRILVWERIPLNPHIDKQILPPNQTALMRRLQFNRLRVLGAILFMILIAFLIRLAVIPFLIGDVLNPNRDHWDFGWEEGRIARSLAAGGGLMSPLFVKNVPTSWANPHITMVVSEV